MGKAVFNPNDGNMLTYYSGESNQMIMFNVRKLQPQGNPKFFESKIVDLVASKKTTEIVVLSIDEGDLFPQGDKYLMNVFCLKKPAFKHIDTIEYFSFHKEKLVLSPDCAQLFLVNRENFKAWIFYNEYEAGLLKNKLQKHMPK